jgi:hypothetical protein
MQHPLRDAAPRFKIKREDGAGLVVGLKRRALCSLQV